MKNFSYLLERGKESNVNKPQGEKNESPECKVVEVPRGGGGGGKILEAYPLKRNFGSIKIILPFQFQIH